MHALDTAEHLKLAEFDHLQQTVDILNAIHDEVRNEPLFVPEKSHEVRDPNSFMVQNTTSSSLYLGQSIFEVDDLHHTKTIAREVGYQPLYSSAISSKSTRAG